MTTVFISYSWENKEHQNWVKELARKLREDGIDAKIDQWELAPGDQLTEFMEKSIRENDFVLVICTPTYKEKSDNRKGGVGYEGDIITSELFMTRNKRKFIPVLRKGSWINSSPSWISGKYYIDLSNDSEEGYDDLFTTLHGERQSAPAIKPRVKNNAELNINNNQNQHKSEEIKIVGIIVDEVTTPKMDGSRGSALYKVPFRLSSYPSEIWKEAFINSWNYPSSYTTMHQPGIARVSRDIIYLDDTTIEEVKRYHRDTLILAVNEANRIEKEHIKKQEKIRKMKDEQMRNHKDSVTSLASEIKFD